MTFRPIGPHFERIPTGAILALYASDPRYDFEIQRAPDVTGTPGTFATIASRIAGVTELYPDGLPMDGAPRWYRIRDVGFGDTPSAWMGPISAIPDVLSVTATRPSLAGLLNILRISSTESADGLTRNFSLVVGALVDVVYVHYRTVPITTDPAYTHDFSDKALLPVDSGSPLLLRATTRVVTFSLTQPTQGKLLAARIVPYAGAVEGASMPVTIDAAPPAPPLTMTVDRGTITGNNIAVTVPVADQYPQSSGDVTVTAVASGGASVATSPQTIACTATTTDLATTAVASFTVTRGSAPGRINFKASAAGRADAFDAMDVEQDPGTTGVSPSSPGFSSISFGAPDYTANAIPISWVPDNAPAGTITYNATVYEQTHATHPAQGNTVESVGVTPGFSYSCINDIDAGGSLTKLFKVFIAMIKDGLVVVVVSATISLTLNSNT